MRRGTRTPARANHADSWRRLCSPSPIHIVVASLCLLWASLLTGCRPDAQPIETVATPTVDYPLAATPPPVTPEAIAAQLSASASLNDAARQFAAAMAIEANAVRVRLDTGACTTCELVENQQGTSLAGLSVADAGKRVKAGDRVYLVVPRFICIFEYDGAIFSPRECRHIPL